LNLIFFIQRNYHFILLKILQEEIG